MEELIKNCVGCRMGIDVWQKTKSGEFKHFDFFATKEAGAVYGCENNDVIGDYLEDLSGNTLYSPKPEYKDMFTQQNYWWEDIGNLVSNILEADPSSNVVKDYFHMDYLKLIDDKTLENKLIVLGKSLKLDIGPDEYPDLLMWETPTSAWQQVEGYPKSIDMDEKKSEETT